MWFSMTGAELPQPVQRSIFICARSRPSHAKVELGDNHPGLRFRASFPSGQRA